MRAERDAFEMRGDLKRLGAVVAIGEPSRRSAERRVSRSARMVGRRCASAMASAAATVLLPVPPLPVTKMSRGRVIG